MNTTAVKVTAKQVQIVDTRANTSLAKPEQSARNYTLDTLTLMIDGLFQSKQSHGFRKLPNGLFEDCLGQVFTVDLQQKAEVTRGEVSTDDSWPTKEDQCGVINHVVLKLKPVAVMGRIK